MVPSSENLTGKMVAFSFTLAILTLLVISGVCYTSLSSLQSSNRWVAHTYEVTDNLQKVYSDLSDMERNSRNYFLTRQSKYRDSYQISQKVLQHDLDATQKMTNDNPIQSDNFTSLSLLVEERISRMAEGLALTQRGLWNRAVETVRGESGKEAMDRIWKKTSDMKLEEYHLLQKRKSDQESNANLVLLIISVGGLATILFCGTAAFFVTWQVKEKQVAANLLFSSEKRFHSLSEIANDSFITVNSQGKIIEFNPITETMFGYPKEELLGKPLEMLMPKNFIEQNQQKAFNEFIRLTDSSQGITSVELSGKRKDETEFPLEISTYKWQTPGDTLYTIFSRDITERKFFTKMLLKNEHRLFQFLEAVPVGILVFDREGRPYYMNQAAKTLLGEDSLRASFSFHRPGTEEAYPPEELPVTKALRGEKCQIDDIEIHLSGQKIPLQLWGAPILEDSGEAKYALMAFLDITERKQMIRSLQEREEFFRNLYEESPIGMVLTSPQNILLNVNQAFCNMVGYSKSELIGKSAPSVIHPEDASLDASLVKKLFNRIIPRYQIEKRYLTKKNAAIWCKVSASLILDNQDQPLFRLSLVENISDQKEVETSLRQSEEKFRVLAENANEGIVSVDSTGNMVYFNRAAENLSGYSKEEALGRPFYTLLAENLRRELQSQLELFNRTGESHLIGRTTELTGKKKNGAEFPAEVSIFTWRTGKGVFLTGILRDITERKQIEDMKRDLISVVSHQLKTPVAEINGYIENMLEGLTGVLTDRQKEYLVDMRDIGMENYRLISDLLSLSKIERGVITVEPEPISLGSLVDLAIRDYESRIEKKGLRLVIEHPDGDFAVLADQDKTVETLRNIINNALKCTDKGSIEIRTNRAGAFGLVEIKDTGIGMSPQVLSRLFTKDRIMGNEAGRAGAGLGLFIAKSFMNLQKSDITVESEQGKGSRFFVKIPAHQQEGL